MESEDSSTDDTRCCGDERCSRKNDTSSSCSRTKTGRKGDPRMHRAVGARLSDPKLTLFEALQVGGFEYLNDDDANVMDSEQITLGQRKNQLSRRIRLAQKQNNNNNNNGSNLGFAYSCSATSTTMNTHSSVAKFSSKLTEIFHNSGQKRPVESSTLTMDEGCLSDDPAYKIPNLLDEHGDSYHQPRIQAKHHPDYRPVVTVLPLLHHNYESADGGLVGNDSTHANFMSNNAPTVTLNTPLNNDTAMSTFGTHLPYSSYPGNAVMAPSAPPPQQEPPTTTTTATTDDDPSVGGAITSLHQTAASVGMTMEQLASALRSSDNLSKILVSGGDPHPSKEQEHLAVSFYQGELRALYQRAMLLAGYTPNVVLNEQSPVCLQFMYTAWQLEGERLRALMHPSSPTGNPTTAVNTTVMDASNHPSSPSHGRNRMSCDSGSSNHQHHHHPTTTMTTDQNDYDQSSGDDHPCHNGHTHAMDHEDIQHDLGCNGHAAPAAATTTATGRHIHRLEGKCGHQPILHQPVGGEPHIDFVIGDRVECYHGVTTLRDLMWPSNYNCDDISCATNDVCRGGAQQLVRNKSQDSFSNLLLPKNSNSNSNNELIAAAATTTMGGDPIIYERSELDFDSDEWNFDFTTTDSLLGLVRLGDRQQHDHLNHHHTD